MIKSGKRASLFLLLSFFSITVDARDFYNVLKYGAKNDSSKIATSAIRKAIAAASAKGGGTVYFPAGKYLTGPIHLKSNITVFIDAGAELHFSDNFDDYLPMVRSRWEGTNVMNFSPLFYGENLKNIAIVGRGLIHGHGKKWWTYSEVEVKKQTEDSKWQTEFKRLNQNVLAPDLPGWIEKGFLRPPFIQFMNCDNVQIKNITITNSPFWTINPQYCNNVTVDGVTIDNPPSPNTDGINPESCSNVHISNCHISVGDDCITIKSGKDRSGRMANVPAENYTITNCTMLRGHGGVVIGSEMSGGVKKITISNCVFDGTDRGLRIKTARGRGGVVEDIRVDNIVMKNIGLQAIVLNMQYATTKPEPVSERTPIFRNIHFSNITAQTNEAGYIDGIEEMPIENITFTDINMDAKTGFQISNAKRIAFHDVEINTSIGSALKASQVAQLEIENLKSFTPVSQKPLIDLNNVKDVFIYSHHPVKGTDLFLKVSGKETADVVLKNNYLQNVKIPIVRGEDLETMIME